MPKTAAQIYQETLATEGQASADLAYQRALEPVAREFAGAPALPAPVAVTTDSPISSTSQLRDETNINKSAAASVKDNLSTFEENALQQVTFGESNPGKKAEQALKDAMDSYGADFTNVEKTQISAAEQGAAAEFAPLIMQAQEQKRQGLPKSVIAAGERGGFLSTQMSGAAATEETLGGTFLGAGGELDNIRGAYDTAILNLKIQQQSAITAARAAAQKAVKTGRKEDLDMARKIFDDAKSSYEAEQKLAMDKVDAIAKVQTIRQSQNQAKTTTFARIKDIGESGVDPMSIGPAEYEQLDAQAGLPPGTSKNIIQTGFEARNAKTAEDEVDVAGKIVNILQDLPIGQEIQIGDSVYTGMKQGNNRIFSETDNSGNVTFVTLDENGNVVNTAKGGKVGKGKTPVITQDFGGVLESLRASAGVDGFANTKVYSDLLDTFRVKGQVSKFLSNFPPEEFLNPNDATAKKFFQTSSQAVKGDANEAIDALIESSI
jgi:hypothetical protein